MSALNGRMNLLGAVLAFGLVLGGCESNDAGESSDTGETSDTGGASDADATPEGTWLAHPCGNSDPVGIQCQDEADTNWEDPSTSLCSDLGVSVGDTCQDVDTTCVLTRAFTCTSIDSTARSSEYALTCRATPFEEGTCPRSSRAAKRSIRYIAPVERQQLAKEVLDVKLATYRYRDAAKPGKKLGFILEDHPTATFSGDGRVDLYAYTSALVGLAQEQQVQIDRLTEQVKALQTAQ
jgi:hypothetical protein